MRHPSIVEHNEVSWSETKLVLVGKGLQHVSKLPACIKERLNPLRISTQWAVGVWIPVHGLDFSTVMVCNNDWPAVTTVYRCLVKIDFVEGSIHSE